MLSSIATAMQATIKEKTTSLSIRLGKIASIANPENSDEWLKEVIIELCHGHGLMEECNLLIYLNHIDWNCGRLNGIGFYIRSQSWL